MRRWYTIEKKLGETPLQALERVRLREHIATDIPMTYAGRLDPMAEGVLLILVGDECKKRRRYDGLDKEYRFEVVFGVSTDTGDVLGLSSVPEGAKGISRENIDRVCAKLVGQQSLPYPLFSSKTVQGTPLFTLAHAGVVGREDVPSATVFIYSLTCTSVRIISRDAFMSEANQKILTLSAPVRADMPGGDFRRQSIRDRWGSVSERLPEYITVFSFSASVSAGTYIRSLAVRMGEELGVPAFAFSIRRTRIGRRFQLFSRYGFWRTSF